MREKTITGKPIYSRITLRPVSIFCYLGVNGRCHWKELVSEEVTKLIRNTETANINANDLNRFNSICSIIIEVQKSGQHPHRLIIIEVGRKRTGIPAWNDLTENAQGCITRQAHVCREIHNRHKRFRWMRPWSRDEGKRWGTEMVRAVKDTVGALEDDAALYHLSHDAPHWPDVHWEQRAHTHTQKSY